MKIFSEIVTRILNEFLDICNFPLLTRFLSGPKEDSSFIFGKMKSLCKKS